MKAKNKTNPKISVVIPVYNTEPYLRRCLGSVVNQTLKEIQIICINDGSTDASLSILEEYAEQDDRIEIINQKNQGLGTTRNNAIPHVKGEYVYYVDSDDWLELNLCEKVLGRIEETGADAVYFRTYYNIDENRIRGTNHFNASLPAMRTLPEHHSDLMFRFPATWSKLVKAELYMSGAVYSDAGIHEEIVNNWRIVLNAKSIAILDEPIYHYRVNSTGSITNTKGAQHFVMLERFEALKELLIETGKHETYCDLYCRVKLFHCRRVHSHLLQDDDLQAEFARHLWDSMTECERGFYRNKSNLQRGQFLFYSRLEHKATHTPKEMTSKPILPESKTVLVLGTQRSLSSFTMMLLESHGAETSIPSLTDSTGFVHPEHRELDALIRLDKSLYTHIYNMVEDGGNYRAASDRLVASFRENSNRLEKYPDDLIETGVGILTNCKRYPLSALKHPGMLLCWDFWEQAIESAKTQYIFAMCVRHPYEIALSYIVRSCRGFFHMSDIYGTLDTYYKVQLSIIEKYKNLKGSTVLPVRANGGHYKQDMERLVKAMGGTFDEKVFADLFAAPPTLDKGITGTEEVFETYQRLLEECERLAA